MQSTIEIEERINQLLTRIAERTKKSKRFKFWEDLQEMDSLLNEISSNSVNGRIDPTAVIKGKIIVAKNASIKPFSVIEGNAYIGKNAEIGPFAYLRGNVIIAEDCRIGRTEVKHSIILQNSKASHFSYIGDSIIGKNVNLGAGTKIANLRFDNKNMKFLINEKIIDSNLRKLGALVCDDVKTGCNVTINCGSFVPRGSFIMPNSFWREK